jgi:hypothetical protein
MDSPGGDQPVKQCGPEGDISEHLDRASFNVRCADQRAWALAVASSYKAEREILMSREYAVEKRRIVG